MLHEYTDYKTYNKDLKYWCNACGELHHFGEEDITERDLPVELQTVYEDLWEENKDGNYVYLVQFKGQNGIALINEYYELNEGESDPNNYEQAKRAAGFMNDNTNYDVILAKELGFPSSDGDATEVVVFFPASVSKEEFDKTSKMFADIAYV